MLMLNNNRGSVEGLGQSGRGGVVKGQQVPSCRQHKYKYKRKIYYQQDLKMFVTVDNTNAFFSGKNRDIRKIKNLLLKFIRDFERVHVMLYILLTK